MRIVGIGLDLTEIDRFSDLIQKEAFLKKCYAAKEQELIAAKGVQAVQTAAANFSGKEAFSKAIGTGFRGLKMSEIAILRDELGKPYIQLLGDAEKQYQKLKFEITLTHTHTTAAAVVIAMQED